MSAEQTNPSATGVRVKFPKIDFVTSILMSALNNLLYIKTAFSFLGYNTTHLKDIWEVGYG